jgi:hypothetical protein
MGSRGGRGGDVDGAADLGGGALDLAGKGRGVLSGADVD